MTFIQANPTRGFMLPVPKGPHKHWAGNENKKKTFLKAVIINVPQNYLCICPLVNLGSWRSCLEEKSTLATFCRY